MIDVIAEEKDMVRAMLSESLQASGDFKHLLKKNGGVVAAHEIMIGIPAIRNLVRENKVAQMYLDSNRCKLRYDHTGSKPSKHWSPKVLLVLKLLVPQPKQPESFL